jgi:hypothetical protein
MELHFYLKHLSLSFASIFASSSIATFSFRHLKTHLGLATLGLNGIAAFESCDDFVTGISWPSLAFSAPFPFWAVMMMLMVMMIVMMMMVMMMTVCWGAWRQILVQIALACGNTR